MGISVTDTGRQDLERIINALKYVLKEVEYIGGTITENNI